MGALELNTSGARQREMKDSKRLTTKAMLGFIKEKCEADPEGFKDEWLA